MSFSAVYCLKNGLLAINRTGKGAKKGIAGWQCLIC
jgi:hypothetical protein